MANAFQKAQKDVLQALELTNQAESDALIGSPAPKDYGVLVAGMNGDYQMVWTMAVSNGMRTSPAVKQMGGQAQLAMLTLMHYAYALGIKHGRDER